jgi:flagellar FliL protein
MSAAAESAAEGSEGEDVAAKAAGGKKRLLILAAPLLVVAIGAGLWFSGILPGLLGRTPTATGQPAEKPRPPPVFFELPEMVANLNAGPRKTSFIKLRARLELGAPGDVAAAQAALPRLQDLFQTYLREIARTSCAVLPERGGCGRS